MAFLTASNISLGGILLQLADDGFSLSSISIVDVGETWLSRDKILSLRGDEDDITFDNVTITGARIPTTLGTSSRSIPINNDDNLDLIYRKVLRREISISGEVMDSADFNSLYTDYLAAQNYWAKYNRYKAQLLDSDITAIKYDALITDFAALARPEVTLTSPLVSGQVTFMEGASCSFKAYNSSIVTGFSLSVILDIDLT